jgi:hypothetical protein
MGYSHYAKERRRGPIENKSAPLLCFGPRLSDMCSLAEPLSCGGAFSYSKPQIQRIAEPVVTSAQTTFEAPATVGHDLRPALPHKVDRLASARYGVPFNTNTR